MKTKKKLILAIIPTLILFSCQKKELLQPEKKHANDKMLVFNTTECFLKEYHQSFNFSFEERMKWETSQGFRSFGSICDSIYLSTDFESFKSIDDLEQFVVRNSNYLQLIKKEDGDFYLETVLYNNPLRYLINSERLCQIGNNIFKAFESVSLQTSIENIEALKNTNEENLMLNLKSNQFCVFHKSNDTSETKDSGNNCGNWDENRKTNGRNRTYLRIGIENVNLGGQIDPNTGYESPRITREVTTYMVRPYIKTLGIWYWCNRTIHCNLKVATGYFSYDSNQWIRIQGNYSNSGTNTSSLSGILSEYNISTGYWANPISHFDGYNCWGDTPDTDYVYLQCNTHLVQ